MGVPARGTNKLQAPNRIVDQLQIQLTDPPTVISKVKATKTSSPVMGNSCGQRIDARRMKNTTKATLQRLNPATTPEATLPVFRAHRILTLVNTTNQITSLMCETYMASTPKNTPAANKRNQYTFDILFRVIPPTNRLCSIHHTLGHFNT